MVTILQSERCPPRLSFSRCPHPCVLICRLQKMQPAGLSYNDLGRWAKSQFSLTPSLPPPSKAGVCRIVKMEDKLQVLGSESQAEKHLLPRRSLLLDVMQLETITFIEEQRLSAAVASSD
ncbi:hypothetical protein PF006_g2795 [Phytophthora fragariae]|uniref:Uncharacterized protein n=1 Tax=Phytophthora fragariae TaxID=53985 RepID=A0A6A3FYJ9_9STRA|nr:hypothetical protein PF009_g939 [Phytophthora fragariae]KAE9153037.1 hypothetical protein PF006_g2795 [Phytophthora fragariae]